MIAGLGKACEIVSNDFQLFEKKYREVRDWFEKKLKVKNLMILLCILAIYLF